MDLKLVTRILTLLVILVSMVLLPLLGICVVIRQLIHFWAKILDPDIDSPVVFVDSLWAVNNKVNRGGHILSMLTLENEKAETVTVLREMFSKTVLKQKLGNELVFKRVKQFWVSFGGYAFWRNDRNFKLENHIRDYDHQEDAHLLDNSSSRDLLTLASKLQTLELKRCQSPWELLVVKDVLMDHQDQDMKEKRTVLVLKTDHILGDIISLVSLAGCLLNANCWNDVPSRNHFRRNRSIMDRIALPWKFAYDVAQKVVDSWGKPSPFRASVSNEKDPVVCGMSKMVKFQSIKQLADTYGVSVFSVLQTVNLESVLRSLIRFGEPIPESLWTCNITLIPNRPAGLSNYVTGAPFKLSTCAANVRNRLCSVHKQLKEQALARPLTYLSSECMPIASGCLPIRLRELLLEPFYEAVDLGFSNVPVITLPDKVGGLTCHEMFMFPPGDVYGILGMISGGNAKLQFQYSMRRRLMHPDFMTDLCNNVTDVIRELLSYVDHGGK